MSGKKKTLEDYEAEYNYAGKKVFFRDYSPKGKGGEIGRDVLCSSCERRRA